VPETATPGTPPPQTPAQQQPEEFVARVDTIEAAGTAGTAGTDTTLADGEVLFSIQIGAYKEPANASAAQSHARERYTLPVLNEFQERPGLYRIRIGNFATREEAAAQLARMRTAFPADYRDSFILQLQR
jgi:cell division septation protein DedD